MKADLIKYLRKINKKPRSLKSDFTLLPDTLDAALRGVQLQPMLV